MLSNYRIYVGAILSVDRFCKIAKKECALQIKGFAVRILYAYKIQRIPLAV